jgi:hypothetical protein
MILVKATMKVLPLEQVRARPHARRCACAAFA